MSLLKVNSVTDLGGDAPAIPPYAGQILQVVSTTKTDTFTTASTSFVDVTGLSASITPSATTSKIFVIVTMAGGAAVGTVGLHAKLLRGSTDIAIGDASGNITRASAADVGPGGEQFTVGITNLDSPSTTSSVTYKMQIRGNTANTVSVNRGNSESDVAAFARTVSTITLLEVAG
jgi:hypothetical protein